jgi:hypothetical protein
VRRRGWWDNIAVLTDDELTMGSMRRSELLQAARSIEFGADVDDTLGTKSVHVQLARVKAMHATLGSDELVVEHEKSGRRATTCIRFPDGSAQQAALGAAEQRIGNGASLQVARTHRLLYALKPLNVAVTLVLIAIAFSHLAEKNFAWRERGDRGYWEQQGKILYSPTDPFYRVPSLGDYPLAAAVAGTDVLLNAFGYQRTLELFAAGCGLAVLVALVRLLRPPLVLTLVVQHAPRGELQLVTGGLH